MTYYTSDLKKIEIDLFKEPFNKGTQGKIYKPDDNKCIKIYGDDVPKFEPEIFNLFKELSLSGVYKLYELLYKDERLQTILAYIMEYYQNEIDNILDEPVEYTLHNINILHGTASVMAEHQILLKDRIPSNVILTKDSVVMIDMDSCIKSIQSKDAIFEVNIGNLLYMFKRLYQEGLKRKGVNLDDNESLSNYLDSLFSYTKEPAKVLSRRMCGARTPMDLLYWRC